MEQYQFWSLVGLLAAGFGWIIHQIKDIDKRMVNLEVRMTVIETVLAMMGMPVKERK